MNSAKIENELVINVAVGLANGYIECPDNVQIGWSFDGVDWTAPVVVPEPPNPIISFDLFESRFTATEWDDATDYVYEVDIVTGKPKRRVLVQGLARAQARNSVDLSDAKTDAFLGILVTGNVITAARKTAILTP